MKFVGDFASVVGEASVDAVWQRQVFEIRNTRRDWL